MDIILQESKNAGNIGAIARAMKNFEFSNLILLNPQCNHLSKEAIDRATHAKEILQNAKIIKKLDYDTLIGATAIIVLYELFKHSKKIKNGENIKLATKEQKEILLKLIEERTQKMAFSTEYKKETQKRVWKKVIGKSNLSKREIMALFGFMKKIK